MQFDPQSPEFRRDPYPYYEMLRQVAPIYFWQSQNAWFITNYDDCKALLRDNRLGHNASPGNSMLFQNPPDHTRLRSLVNVAFTPRMVEKYRDTAQTITDQLLTKVESQGQMDVIADLAYPLPVRIIAEMLGVPAEDYLIFQEWSHLLVQGLDLADMSHLAEQHTAAIEAFRAYFANLIAERRQAPKDDLLTALVEAEADGESLTEDELYTTSRLLLVAGHETTVNLIGNSVGALLQNPAQRDLLQANPALITTAIEEFLRYDSPIQLVGRTALEDVAYQEHTFQKGQAIYALLGAANRDPAQFEQADKLDITRQKNPHLAFSHGIHYCLGAPLARLESQIAINTLLRRMPNLALNTDTLTYRDNFVFRGLETIPVIF